MKVAYISTSTIPSRTANSIHVMKMCSALANIGNEVILYHPGYKDIECNVKNINSFYGVGNNFKIIKVPVTFIPGKGYLYGLSACIQAIKEKPDIIVGRNLAGLYFASFTNIPIIFEAHSPISYSGSISEYMFRRLIKRKCLQKVVLITNSLKQYFVNKYSHIETVCQVLPDAADPVPEDIKPIYLPNKGNKLQVGYIGHLYKGKGFEVIEKLAPKCMWADFHVIGGTKQDMSLIQKNKQLAKNIHIHGFKPYNEALSFRLSCDVLLLPNQYEVAAAGKGMFNISEWTSPLKLFEYMAAQKAIIASNLPVIREVLTNGVNALLCDPICVEEWEIALKKLSNDEALRISIAKNAFNDFNKNFTWNIRAEKFIKC